MAKRTTGSLKAKLAKANKVAKKVKDSTENYQSRIDLPGGLSGIAQLSSAAVGEYKTGDYKGELFLRLEGVIVESNEVGGITYEGQYTSQMLPLHEKGERSEEENIDRALAMLRKIGYETEEMEDLESLLEECVEEGNYFSFSTRESPATKQYAARVWETWMKQVEDFVPEEDDGVEDDSEPEDDEEEPEEEEEEEEEEDEELEEPDEEEEDEEEESDDEDEEEEDEDFVPEKGENYFYKPPRKRKKVLIEVTRVLKSKQTCDCKDEADKIYKAITWDELSYDEE